MTWAVVTSGAAEVASARLAAAGIAFPPLLVAAGDVTAGKPEPDCYLTAAERLGVPAAECLVIEDAPAGIAAARAAEMPVVGVVGTVTRDDLLAHVVVDCLDAVTVLDAEHIQISRSP